MFGEIVILLARGAFAGPAHVARLNFVGSNEPVTDGTLTYGGTHRFDFWQCRLLSRR